MPTNLPPEFYDADRKYREAATNEEKIAALEEMLTTIPKHKGTDKLRAEYRKKLSKLKSVNQTKKQVSKHDSHFVIEKEGAGRIIALGSANTGKSSLIKTFSHASPEISENPYTTWIPTPGMMNFENVQFQLIDTPPLDRDYLEPEFINLIKSSDLVILMLDIQAYPLQQIDLDIRVLKEYHIMPESFKPDEPDKRVSYIPFIILVNKVDSPELMDEFEVLDELLGEDHKLIPFSLKNRINYDKLMESLLRTMNIIRVYSKPPHEDADMSQPFVLKTGDTLDDFARKVHRDFAEQLKSARVWGENVYDGQHIGHDYILSDGDIIELHI